MENSSVRAGTFPLSLKTMYRSEWYPITYKRSMTLDLSAPTVKFKVEAEELIRYHKHLGETVYLDEIINEAMRGAIALLINFGDNPVQIDYRDHSLLSDYLFELIPEESQHYWMHSVIRYTRSLIELILIHLEVIGHGSKLEIMPNSQVINYDLALVSICVNIQ